MESTIKILEEFGIKYRLENGKLFIDGNVDLYSLFAFLLPKNCIRNTEQPPNFNGLSV